MRFAGWMLMALGALGTGGLLLDVARLGLEEDRVGGIVVGLLVIAGGATLVWLS